MKAIQLLGPKRLRMAEVPIPEINDNEALLKVRAASICGTDVRMYLNGYKGVTEETPLVLCHEFSGDIVKTGANVTSLRPGMKVSVAPNMGCGTCDMCVSGNTHLCRHISSFGVTMDGGLQEYVKIPAEAIHHEKIDDFPPVPDPENYALGVHCGYAGFAPRSFCSKWKMVPKVLAIVDENAYMINCELPTGDMVLAKINPSFDRITVIPGQLEKYVQFPGTDARNASLLHYSNGEKVMEELPSHHQMIITGRQQAAISQIARVFGWTCEVIS